MFDQMRPERQHRSTARGGGPESTSEDASDTSNQDLNSSLESADEGVSLGGDRYTIQRGDTLWGISQRTYGHGRYWRDIMRANPDSVFRDGDLILVGDVLDLPVIQVPAPPGLDTGAPPAAEGSGEDASEPATAPREVCTEYGDFRIYPDDFVGELPVSTDGVTNVRESEYEALVAEREAEAEAAADETVEEVNDLLSYGLFDWAITDAEARAALEKLAALPMRQLQGAVTRIDVGRLLDNLPDDCYGTPAFAKVVVALGPDAVQPYLSALLSYSLFDWAVTDGDARAVMAVLGVLSAEQKVAVLTGLGPALQTRFLENLPARGSGLSDADKAVVKAIFDNATDLALMTLAFEVRFNLDVRGADGVDWEANGLRQCWPVLEALPPAQVEANPELLAWIRRSGPANSIGGSYGDAITDDSAKIKYDPTIIATRTQSSQFDVNGDGVITDDEKDPLHGVNRFDKVVRHEVGHAVDDQVGGAASYCIGNAAGGNWADHGNDPDGVVEAMVNASAGGISAAPEAARNAIVAQLKTDVGDPSLALANVKALAEYQALTAEEQAAVDADPVFNALSQAVDDPWYNHLPNGGTPLGGRIFQRSYDEQWTSYAVAARGRKVSQYQFRAPGEWFAEAYAAYYQPNSDGSCDHSVLAGADPAAKVWFDNNVDTVVGSR